MLQVFDSHKIRSSYVLHIWTIFIVKWYLDKDRNMLKFEFKIWLYTNYTVENWDTMALNECLPIILKQTQPHIVSTNLSMI